MAKTKDFSDLFRLIIINTIESILKLHSIYRQILTNNDNYYRI